MANEDPKKTAEYTKDMIQDVFPNNAVSSVMVPYGYTVELFKTNPFSGDKATMNGPEWIGEDET